MRLDKLIATISIVCVCISSNGQSNLSKINRIGIGDEVPANLPLINLVNYPESNAYVSDFKGKWLILDYWFTGCGPCIQSWPKLMELQKKFSGKIQIMSVNHMQNKKTVEAFIKKRNLESNEPFSIPSVTGDTVVYKVLPPFGYPSVVWIDPQGVYRASTDGADLNEENIKSALENKNIQTLVANTSFMNLKRPLFIDGNGGTGQQMLWYSTVSKYSTKVTDGAEIMSADSSGYVIAAIHKPIVDLIMRAYSEGPLGYGLVNYVRLPRTRMELRVKDSKRLWPIGGGERPINDLYTYQLISYAPQTMHQLKETMRDDLRKYFHLEMKWEKVKKECLVLTAEDTTLLGDKSNKKPVYGYNKNGSNFLRDVPVYNFFGYLTEYIGGIYNEFNGYPLVNETNFKGGLDLVFENVTAQNNHEIFADYKKLNAVLAKYKMRLNLEVREIDVLIVTDTNVRKDQKEFHNEFK